MQIRISFMAVVFALVVLLVGTSSLLAQENSCKDCHSVLSARLHEIIHFLCYRQLWPASSA